MATALGTTISVPLNTMLADLDESLRTLLKRELGRHGFDGDRDLVRGARQGVGGVALGAGRQPLPLRPPRGGGRSPDRLGADGGRRPRRELRPPLRIDASFAVTGLDARRRGRAPAALAGAGDPLRATRSLPDDVLERNARQRLAALSAARRGPRTDRHEDASDFWTAVGGQYKASFNYVVTLACEAGTSLERGPEVRTQTIRTYPRDGGRATIEETAPRPAASSGDAGGAPVANAWVALPERGTGRPAKRRPLPLRPRSRPGTYRCVARGPDGTETSAELTVPGAGVELAARRRARARRKRGG